VALALLIICVGVGACSAEKAPGQIIFIQGGSSTLSDGLHGTKTLTMSDVIPYYTLEVANRTIIMPMKEVSRYTLPLNAALVLNGADGKSVYLVKTTSWTFDEEKKSVFSDLKG
jgi:hypothetical protein